MSISKIIQTIVCATLALTFMACDDDEVKGPDIVTGATIDANVGGETQPNQVFIDLSTKTQTVVERNTWDLGFYNGNGFHVVINSSVSSLARPLDKSDLNQVTEEDTVGWNKQLDIDAIFATLFGAPPEWLAETAGWIDHPSGDITKTAIAEISENVEDNNVYILNRGKNPDNSQRGWMKIRVLRNVSGYTLQYADINETAFSTIDITKDTDFNFTFISLSSGIVNVEPQKNTWDIAFTTYTNLLPIGATTSIPYAYKDFVIQNGTIETAMVTATDELTYETFSPGNTTTLEFKTTTNAIGSGWRTVAQPGSGQETDVNHDRFYVLKDVDGNIYKLRFTRMLDPISGERGYPQLEYELVD